MHNPKNKRPVNNFILNFIFPSSFSAKSREITGDVLNNVHPIPKGRVLKTTCCSNIPMFVPSIIERKNLI